MLLINETISTLTSPHIISLPNHTPVAGLVRLDRFPGVRALAWSGDVLYGSRGYDLLSAKVGSNPGAFDWEYVARFNPGLRRNLSVRNSLTARLFRDGFHALAVLPSGGSVAAVPGAIVTLQRNEKEFRQTHKIARGTRPLHITAVPNGGIFWGEYFDNPSRDEVHIYGSSDHGLTWSVSYTFAKGAIRHVHNIVHDPWGNCLWVLTGDNGDECRILRASCDFGHVETVLQGKQQCRAVAAIPAEGGLYFSSDTPLEQNFIYRLDRSDKLSQLTRVTSSSIYGCRVADELFFSTMIEPSDVNLDRFVRVYQGSGRNPGDWKSVLAWQKDRWPMNFFQYGNAVFPDGNNTTSCLAVTSVAVQADDLVTSIYSIHS
jgi:hypothetical protein